jgi:uncharacterized protein YqjF (DUF2071 family)
MSGVEPEETVGWAMARQTWRSMSFLHWGVPVEAVNAVLPGGLVADEFDGRAWIGLTAFEVDDFRVGPLPAVPKLSRYPETNVRTYVRTPSGTEGIWLLTLEVDSAMTVAFARPLLGVPYRWARMRVTEDGDQLVRYESRRRGVRGGHPGYRIEVYHESQPTPEVDDLDYFLTGRWRAVTRRLGRMLAVPTEHERWPLHAATVREYHESLLGSLGLGILAKRLPDRVRWSPGVHARLGFPRPA